MKLRPLCTHGLAAPCSSPSPAPSHPRRLGKAGPGMGRGPGCPRGSPPNSGGWAPQRWLRVADPEVGLLELPLGPDTQATVCSFSFSLLPDPPPSPGSRTPLGWGPSGAESELEEGNPW